MKHGVFWVRVLSATKLSNGTRTLRRTLSRIIFGGRPFEITEFSLFLPYYFVFSYITSRKSRDMEHANIITIILQ